MLLGELARRPGRRARSAQRDLDVAKQVRAVLAADNGVEGLTDAAILWMGTKAEAQARPVPQGLLGAPDHRLDIRPIDHLSQCIGGWPQPLQRVGDGLPDSPADLGQGVG